VWRCAGSSRYKWHVRKTIGIMAPSSAVEAEGLRAGVAALEARGARVVVHPQTFARRASLAGTPAEKAAALRDLLADPQVEVIWAARGGNGAVQALPHIPNQAGKPLIGYSDATAWLAVMGGVHGPAVTALPQARAQDIDAVFAVLEGGPFVLRGLPFRPGRATGRIVGGNLAVLSALIGTPFAPDFTGAILALEDWREEASRIDRFLAHLANAGALARIAGLAFGDFLLQDTGVMPYGLTLEESIAERTAGLHIPIAVGLPFGHGGRNTPFPIGARAVLEGGVLRSPE
jgi:muramoyltetrapeptide carboxypeptidase